MTQAASITHLKSSPFAIERGVPHHALARSPLIEAFRNLAKAQIGDSFFCPETEAKNGPSIHERAVRVGGKGWVSLRKVEGGWRVWKIAEPKFTA